MIIDTLKNIHIYKNLSDDIFSGLIFIQKVSPEIELGDYPINSKVKAIVSEYETIALFERGFEAHKHTIDIQYPVKGIERVKWSPIAGMQINIPYEEKRDRTFYKNPS